MTEESVSLQPVAYPSRLAEENWVLEQADRMSRGVHNLYKNRDACEKGSEEYLRLSGKAEGLKLAESYLREAATGIPEYVRVGYYRNPDTDGERIHDECGYRFHDHGFIDFGSWGLPVCPSTFGPFPGQSTAHLGSAVAKTVGGSDRDQARDVLRDFLLGRPV